MSLREGGRRKESCRGDDLYYFLVIIGIEPIMCGKKCGFEGWDVFFLGENRKRDIFGGMSRNECDPANFILFFPATDTSAVVVNIEGLQAAE